MYNIVFHYTMLPAPCQERGEKKPKENCVCLPRVPNRNESGNPNVPWEMGEKGEAFSFGAPEAAVLLWGLTFFQKYGILS